MYGLIPCILSSGSGLGLCVFHPKRHVPHPASCTCDLDPSWYPTYPENPNSPNNRKSPTVDGGNLAPFLPRRFLTAPYPLLALALKASRSKFVPMTEILHRLRQNSCQCQKGGAGMRRHVIENAYYAGGARFPPSTAGTLIMPPRTLRTLITPTSRILRTLKT